MSIQLNTNTDTVSATTFNGTTITVNSSMVNTGGNVYLGSSATSANIYGYSTTKTVPAIKWYSITSNHTSQITDVIFGWYKNYSTRALYIDGAANTVADQGSFIGTNTSPESSSAAFIGHGMRRYATTNGFNFAWGESISSTTEPGIDLFPIGGTHITSGILFRMSKNSTKTSVALQVNGDGKVGIGTTTPSGTLHVIGDIVGSGNLTITGRLNQTTVHCVAGLSSDQTVTANSDTVLQLTDKDDPNNWWNASTYRFLPTASGYYYISAQVSWDPGTGNGQINTQLRKNGNTFSISQNIMVTGVSLTQHLTGIVNMNGSTDYVELTAYTSSAAGSQIVNGTADQAWTKLEAFKIS